MAELNRSKRFPPEEAFEPWAEADACLFDSGLDWGAAITHEDKILCRGTAVTAQKHG